MWLCRRRPPKEVRRIGTLFGRNQSFGDDHRRLPDVFALPLPQRRLRPRQAPKAEHLSQLQLHGSADGLRTILETRKGVCIRRPRPRVLRLRPAVVVVVVAWLRPVFTKLRPVVVT